MVALRSVLGRRRVRRQLLVALLVLSGLAVLLSWGDRPDAYVPGERSEGVVDTLARHVPDDHPGLVFHDVSAEWGLDFEHFGAARSNRLPEDMGSGVALGDVDGDGWTDAFLVGSGPLSSLEAQGPSHTCRLYRNRQGASFEDITEVSGTGLAVLGMGALFADLEGDQDLDLVVSAFGRCHVLTNDGAGRFTDDVEGRSGLGSQQGFWTGLAAGDPDLDGDVDLYVCGYVRYEEALGAADAVGRQYGADIPALINPSTFDPEPNLFLRNRGDGSFDEVAAAAGVSDPAGRGLAAAFADFDRDGLPDLYVANDVSDNVLFHNRGDGSFEDLTSRALVGDYRGAMGLAIADVDDDHDLDLFITHWTAQENALYINITSDLAEEGRAPTLMFVDEADRHGLGQVALRLVGWATGFVDFDNDGLRDLFVVNGSTIPVADDRALLTPMRSQLFWNAGASRRFFDVGPVSGEFFRREAVGRGGASFDADLDGAPDLLISLHGERAVLLHNQGAPGHALRLRLRQPSGNTLALGAWAALTVDGRTLVEQVGTQGSYLSQHAAGELGFGLGQSLEIEQLEVTWPDGTQERLGPVPADRLVTWTRGAPPVIEVLPGVAARAAEPPADVDLQRRFYARLGQASEARLDRRLEDAVAAYREALGWWPGHEECLYYLGNSLLEAGRQAEALAAFEELGAWHPRSSRAFMQLGALRLPGGDPALDDLAAARAAFARAHAINGEESGPAVRMGLAALLDGDLPEAERLLGAASRLNNRSVESLYWLGWIAWQRGDASGAAEQLGRARELATAHTRGASVSGEGDTHSGRALTVESEVGLLAEPLLRWRSLGEREADPLNEYGALVLPGAADD